LNSTKRRSETDKVTLIRAHVFVWNVSDDSYTERSLGYRNFRVPEIEYITRRIQRMFVNYCNCCGNTEHLQPCVHWLAHQNNPRPTLKNIYENWNLFL